jgi:hypothetical protein
MHNKPKVTKDETLSVASRTNGQESRVQFQGMVVPEIEPEQEEKFLADMLAGYSYWNKQPGNLAKSYAAAYRTLLNEFTAEETEK